MEDCLFRICRVTRIYLLPKKARLELAIATYIEAYVEPDILILDEILSVEDESFRNKSEQKVEDFWQDNVTILLFYYFISFISVSLQ